MTQRHQYERAHAPSSTPGSVNNGSRTGWAVVFASLVGLSLGVGPVPFYTIGLLAPELSRAFGWSFGAIMGGIAVQSVATVVISPVFGGIIDRFGARPVALTSLVCFGVAYMSLALTPGALWVFYAQWAVMTLSGAGTLSATWTRVVNGWFDKRRGLALGIASTGTGLTGLLIKPLTAWLIGYAGWQVAVIVIGTLPILIGTPIVAMLFIEPVEGSGARSDEVTASYGNTLREAVRQPRFWVIAGAFTLIGFSITAPTPNLENILRSMRFDLATAARIAGTFGLAVILGRVVGGWLLDRVWAPACALLIFALPAAGCWALSFDAAGVATATCAVAAIGFGAGFEFDLLAYLTNRYFGQRAYGAIYGIFYACTTGAGGLGPVVYGRVYDIAGSYSQALAAGTFLMMLGAAFLLILGRYPNWGSKAEITKLTG